MYHVKYLKNRCCNMGEEEYFRKRNIPTIFRYVVPRNDHRCKTCQYIILKGESALNKSGFSDRRFFNDYFCGKCDLEQIQLILNQKLRSKLLNERNCGPKTNQGSTLWNWTTIKSDKRGE